MTRDAPADDPVAARFFERLGFPTLYDAADGDHHARIHRALAWLEPRLCGQVSIPQMARVACYTPRHFQRVFRTVIGEGVSDHIKRLRMLKAARLLRYHPMQVLDAALATGYESASGFTRAFTEVHGMSPTEYRERHPAPRRYGDKPVSLQDAPVPLRREIMPPLRVAYLRHTGHPARSLGLWLRLLTWAWRRGLLAGGTARPAGIYRDGPETDIAQFRYDAALIVPATFEADGSGIGLLTLPGGPVLVHEFRGTASAAERRWDFLCDECLPRTGHRFREDWYLDLYAPHQLAPLRLSRIMTAADPVLEMQMIIPVAE